MVADEKVTSPAASRSEVGRATALKASLTHGELDEDQARCTAAVVVTALRLVLERSTRPGSDESPVVGLGETLRYLRAGAHL